MEQSFFEEQQHLLPKEASKRLGLPPSPLSSVRRFEKENVCSTKQIAFVFVGLITFLYVLAELSVAVWIHSLVLLSDGFHNLSDVISLYIAYWAAKATNREQSDEMSYGWSRTEIVGGLTNGCFLLSLCLYVVLEAIPKFIQPVAIEGGIYFIIIAATGLAINTVGTIVFKITGNSHGHSHSHSHSHKHGSSNSQNGGGQIQFNDGKKEKKHSHGHDHDIMHEKKKKYEKKKDLNVHAVFLHYLGDAFSSLLVLGAGVMLHFFDGAWKNYIDPVSSLLIVSLMLFTTVPLVKRCSMILLQSTPDHIPMSEIRNRLSNIEGIINMHDFHVWQLIDGMVISSVHVAITEGADFSKIVEEIRKVFHEYGIHSTSIQPEFLPPTYKDKSFCNQNCVSDCREDWCCKKKADLCRMESTYQELNSTSTFP